MEKIWLTILAAGLLTYATRLSFILLVGNRDIPQSWRRALRFVPPAVLTAIIFPELLISQGHIDITTSNIRLLAGILAALVAWRTRNIIATLATGMATLLLLQAISS
jgi:branched-subunit amino acid transport protein